MSVHRTLRRPSLKPCLSAQRSISPCVSRAVMRNAIMASTVRISFSDSGRRVDRSASRKRLSYRRPARSLASVPLNRQSPLISENCIVKCFTMYRSASIVKLRVRRDPPPPPPPPPPRGPRGGGGGGGRGG